MINNQLLKRALDQRRAMQAANERVEAQRREEAIARCPEIEELMLARQAAISRGLQMALDGRHPGDAEHDMLARNHRIQALLVKHGFPKDYLGPVYNCALCRDSGYTGETVKGLCRCVVDSYHTLVQGDAFLNNAHTFESYDERLIPARTLPGAQVSQRAYTRLLRDACERFADSLPGAAQQSLLLYGGSGLGKTFLLHCIGARAVSRGVQTLALTANALLNQIRRDYFSRDEEAQAAYYQVPLLLLDDLGTEPMWENITIEQLFALIDHRLTRGMHTVISTNLSLTEMKARYTERIMSRLLDVRRCEKLAFLGEDLRLLHSDP